MGSKVRDEVLVVTANCLEELEGQMAIEELIIPLDEELNRTGECCGISFQAMLGWPREPHESKDRRSNPWLSGYEGESKDCSHGDSPVANGKFWVTEDTEDVVEDSSPISHCFIGQVVVIGPTLTELQERDDARDGAIFSAITVHGAVNGAHCHLGSADKASGEGDDVPFSLRP